MSPIISSIFSALERLGGTPIELYTFARGSKMWRYTSSGSSVTVAATGLSYAPAMISRGRVSRGGELGAITVELTFGRLVPIAQDLLQPHNQPMALGIHRYQPGVSSVPILLAFGDLIGAKWDGGMVQADLVSAENQFSRPFPNKYIERQCQWSTYSAQCGVNEADFSHETTIVDITRSKILVDSIDGSATDGYYDHGQILYANGERSHIDTQIDTELHVFGAVPYGVVVGDTVTLLAGDDKTMPTCRDKFHNIERFLGFDRLPIKDPYQNGVL